MKRTWYMSLFLVVVIVLGAMPVHAQTDDLTPEELEWVAFVAASFDALFALDTLQAETSQTVNQTIGVGEGFNAVSIHQVIAQTMYIQVENGDEGLPASVYSQLEQNTISEIPGTPAQELSLHMEMLYTDGEYLMRVTDVPLEMTNVYPDGWFDPVILSGSGIDMGSLENLSGREALSSYPITPETVIRIKELPSEEIDGVAMRVFEIVLSPELVLEISGMDAMLDPASLGAGGDEFYEQMIDAMTFSERVWIGAEDGLPYRITFLSVLTDAILPLQGQEFTVDQTTEAATEYFGFNEPVEIIEPVDGF